MALSQKKSKKSPTGSRYRSSRKKKQFELGREPTLTKIGETKLKRVRVIGGSDKIRLLSCNVANVLDKKTNKYSKTKIITILENAANRYFVRRNILTKGSVIETEKGKAVVVSRPGQEGSVTAVLL